MKIVKFPEESGLSIKCVSERIKNEAKEQKEGYLVLLLGKGNLSAGKGTIRAGEDTIRADQDF